MSESRYPLSEAEFEELIFVWKCIERLQRSAVEFYGLSGKQHDELIRLQARSDQLKDKIWQFKSDTSVAEETHFSQAA
jgi:hypothetical protein